MSLHNPHHHRRSKDRKGRPIGRVYLVPSLWVEGPHRALVFITRHADVLAILHSFSRRVVSTCILPAGITADMSVQDLRGVAVSFLQRSGNVNGGKSAGVTPPAQWVKHHPALVEYLFSEVYPDGVRRQRSTVTIMAGDAHGLKVVLNDREEGRSLWATGEDLDGCLEALEAMLQSPETPWRLDKQGYTKGGKKT